MGITKQEFLGEIIDVVNERNDTHGKATADFDRIAAMWNVLFADKMKPGSAFEADEVAMAMICLKLSRITWNPDHKDSWQDIAGYAACGWECRDNGKEA